MPIPRQAGLMVLFHMLSVVGQSIFFGVLLFTFPVSVYIIFQRGLRRTADKFLLGMMGVMFAFSAMFWADALADVILLILNLINNDPNGPSAHRPVFNALVLVNFVITDGVVVWRAWAISREKRVALLICTAFLILTGATVLLIIAVRMVTLTSLNRPFLTQLIDTTQTVNLGLSLLTNILATTIISIKAWKYRKELYSPPKKKQTNAAQILFLIIESGMIYCASGVLVFVATIIRLPYGTLGDIYQPIHSQLSGVYPTAVLILVSQQKSLENNIVVSGNTDASYGAEEQQLSIHFREVTSRLSEVLSSATLSRS